MLCINIIMEPSDISSSPKPHKYNTRSKNKKVDEISEVTKYKDDSDEEFDKADYHEFLSKMFPSAYMRQKAKATRSLAGKPSYNIIIAKSNGINKKNKHKRQKLKYKDDESDEFLSDEEYLNSDDSDDSDDESSDEESENDSDEESSDESENDSDEESSDEESSDEESENDSDNESSEDDVKNNKKKIAEKNLKRLSNKLKRQSTKQFINSLVVLANERKRKISKKKNKKKKKIKEFEKLINLEENLNDVKYFKKELDDNKKDYVIEELKKINTKYKIDKPYRILVLEADIPYEFKIVALKKISMLENMDPSASEYFKLKGWIDSFMRLPFNKIQKFPININDGYDKCGEYMKSAVDTLDSAVYGLNDAKMQIMQLFGQWITNPDAIGSAIAIKGPMGTGKTTLVKEGISKILNRPFALIALGGATDASVLEGHGYTYEGSVCGKIVDILMQTQCSNPIIYFDELDKVSDTPKGEEIIGILTHLIDTTQNTQFHDKYFSEIDFDLSKALFIFSYNDESKINPILRDRMYRITTKGYGKKDKNVIAKSYLLPNICKQVNFPQDSVIIEDDVIDYIVENFTEKEDGVRNLKRCLEIIYTKLNLYRLMPEDSNLFKDENPFKVEFPFTVTSKIIDKLIKREQINDNWKVMYM